MILSTKKVRMLEEGHIWACVHEGCNRPAEFKDLDSEYAACVEHTAIEDLDPECPKNQTLLANVPVSRMAAFPEIEKFSDLFGKRSLNKERGARGLWISLPVGCVVKGGTAEAKDILADFIMENLVYGDEAGQSLDKFYYVQVVQRDDIAVIHIKYQQILGTRLIGMVPWESVVEFFGERT